MVTFHDAPDAATLIRANALARGDSPALFSVYDVEHPEGGRTLTYRELDARARRIAAWLGERAAPGDRVLLLYADSMEFAAGLVGCLYAGAVAVPAPLPGAGHRQQRLTAIAADADVAAVFADAGSLPAVAAWAADSGRTGNRLTPLTTDGDGPPADPDAWRQPSPAPGATALIQYTSGSTTAPKGVMVGHGNLLHNARAISRRLGLDEHTRFGGWVPLFHDMGLIGLLLESLLVGGSCAFMPPVAFLRQPHAWLRMIDEYDITVTAAPNFAYELCCRRVTPARIAGLDLSRWRHAVNGSEPIRPSTLAEFARRFGPAGFRAEAMAPSYGLAEATLMVSGTSGRLPVVRRVDAARLEHHEFVPVDGGAAGSELASCGPVLDGDVRIVDPDGLRVLPEDAVGEVWVRSASVTAGYWRNEAATRAAFGAFTADGDGGDGGYLRTGDLGALHAGELYITGRLKETMVIHGRNLYPQDVEHELRARHDALAGLAGAVFAVGGHGTLTDDAVVVTHEVRGPHDPERLHPLATRVRETVAREFGVPVADVLLLRPGDVRRTTSGKIQRGRMRELYLAGALQPPGAAP